MYDGNINFGPNILNGLDDLDTPIMRRIRKDTFEDRAFGCILGAFIGDSCGSYMKNHDELVSEQMMDRTMEMLGGGYSKTGPGQVSDGGELGMCLLWGLVEGIGPFKGSFIPTTSTPKAEVEMSTKEITTWYTKWINDPSETEQAITNGLEPLKETPRAKAAYKAALKKNKTSLTNGSLKRLAPLAVWCSALTAPEDMYKAVKADAQFTHPHVMVHDAAFLYSMAIQHLLSNPEDPDRCSKAFDVAFRYSQSDLVSKVDSDLMGVSPKNWLVLAKQMHEATLELEKGLSY